MARRKKQHTAKTAARAIIAALDRGDQAKANEIAERYCSAVDPYFGSRSYVQRSGRLYTLGIEVRGNDWQVRPKLARRRAAWGLDRS